MLKDGYTHASADAFRRALREAQVEAQRLLEAVASALLEDAALLSAAERAQIDAGMLRLQSVLVGDDRLALDGAMANLNAATADFAARRMNRSVKRALSGKNIAELPS